MNTRVFAMKPMLSLCALLLSASFASHAAPPPAGTQIGNQASATYTDASNTARSVTSNVVIAVVQQVAGVTHTQSASRTASIGSQVTYPLTITNTGNGTDSFNLAFTQSGAFNFTSVQFYADANGDGVADNTTPITSSGALAQDGVFRYVAVGTVPTGAAAGNSNSLVVTATSVFSGATTAAVTETTTITSNAVLAVTKAMSASNGAPGSGPFTVTLTYSNSGNSAATAVRLRDLLPAGLAYVNGSARWSATGATVLTDADATDAQGGGPTIVYDYGITAANQVNAQISSVAPGQSGTLSFQVNIAGYSTATATGQLAGSVLNTASLSYNDGAGVIGPVPSNTFGFTVNAVAAATMSGQTVPSAVQGATVTFTNTLRNTGNASDSFDVTIAANSYPAGSTVTIYQADGVTPLLDTNGNGIADTGPLASGATTSVVIKVTLPTGATGGPYALTKTATSAINPAVSASATDTLSAIVANSVDLTNNSAGAGAPGAGPGVEASAVVTNNVLPGATTRFTLYVNNTSAQADTFNLAASIDASFATSALPAGWTVIFRDASDTVITNSGLVAGGASKVIYADIAVPAGQAALPAGQQLYFRILSPTTSATDRLHDAVIVQTVRSVQITPNNSGQVFPGGSVVYAHTISNAGNVAENGGGANTVTLALANAQASFSSVLYLDVNNSNTIDAGDVVINTAADLGPLAAGQSKRLLVKVTAISGAAIGSINTTTVTATTAGPINGAAAPTAVNASDATTVIAGNLALLKEQALDANCDGIADTAFSAATVAAGAVPGACVRYRITVTNNGTVDVTTVIVSDAMPAFTTYHAAVPAATSQGTVSAPAAGATGTVSAAAGTLAPSASVVITFGVRINP
jgi:trimeric autotransporter adhesin